MPIISWQSVILHLFLVGLLLPIPCLSTKFLKTASSPSLRRARSMTSSTDIVLRPACLSGRQRMLNLQAVRAYFEKLSRSWLTFSRLWSMSFIKPQIYFCEFAVPICAHTISVNAPMNCGVALTPSLSVSSSTILPIENQRAALSRYSRQSSWVDPGSNKLPLGARRPLHPACFFLRQSWMWAERNQSYRKARRGLGPICRQGADSGSVPACLDN